MSLPNVEYLQDFLSKSEADEFLNELKELDFFTPVLKIRNRNIKPKRKIIAYGDDGLSYTFSGTTVPALSWTPLLLQLRDRVERHVGCTYNYALLNYYGDGNDYIAQHRDDESCLDATFPLAVISLGETRTLEFKKPRCETISYELQHGSLYILKDPTNQFFTHGIPPDSSKKGLRISVSFRHILSQPSSKKSKVDPDWQLDSNAVMAEDMLMESNPLIAQWDLGFRCFVNVLFENDFLRLHIRQYNELLHPTKSGVVMLLPTWSKLCDKLSFHVDGFVANKQLLVMPVDGDRTLFQQLFYSKVSGFYLKNSFLTLNEEQIVYLKDFMSDINESLIAAQFNRLLPNLIFKKANICHSHFAIAEEARQYFLTCFQNEVIISLNAIYPCAGCMFNDACQFNHECMRESLGSKFTLFREKVLLNFNVFNMLKQLEQKCLCHYTQQFLKQLDNVALENFLKSI